MPTYTCKHCQLTLSDRLDYNKHISHCIPSINVEISEGLILHFQRKDGQFHCTCYGQRCSKTYDTTSGFERHVKKTQWSMGEGQEDTPYERASACVSDYGLANDNSGDFDASLQWPGPLKPLKHIAHHGDSNTLVCVSCGIVVLRENIFGHIRDQHRIRIRSKQKASIDQSLTELGIEKGVLPSLPRGPIPPFPWLKPPVKGFYCRLCDTLASPSEQLIAGHIPTCRRSVGDKGDVSKPIGDADLQQFTLASVGSSWFRVYPALQNCDPQGRFMSFFQNLSPEAKEGGPIYKSLSTPDQSSADQLDVSPFLSRVRWLESTESYSLFKMRRTVALPSKDDPYFAIKGLGQQLLSSISSLKGVQHNILSGLMAWRNSGDEFRLVSRGTSSNYALSVDRLVLTLLRSSQKDGGGNSGHIGSSDPSKNKNELRASGQAGGNVVTTRRLQEQDKRSEGADEDENDREGKDVSEYENESGYEDEDKSGYEDEDESEYEEEDEDGSEFDGEDEVASEPSGISDWEQALWTDNAWTLGDDDSDNLSTDNGKPDFPILLSNSQANAVEGLRSLLRDSPTASNDNLFKAYTEVIFQIFASQAPHSSSMHEHTPIEAFLMSAAVSPDLSFRTSLQMSSIFSHVQYLCFFVILFKCLKDADPEECFNRLKSWVDPSHNNALSSIRRYHRLAYRDARNYIKPPDIQFIDNTHFTFQGVSMDVTHFMEALHNIYEEANTILRKDLLFGLTDEQLGVDCSTALVDNLRNSTPGYGILASERDTNWTVMKHILETQELFDKFYYESDGKRYPRKQAQFDYLKKCAAFRKLFYMLLHWLSGMPKRGSEEARFRIANTPNRMRNICFLYGQVGIIGRYCKTTAITGRESATLHFLPPAIAVLLRRFHASIANVEAHMVDEVVKQPDTHWRAFLFTDAGKRLKSSALSAAFKKRFPEYPGVTLGLQNLRHIIPAIVEEFGVSEASFFQAQNSPIIAYQMAHSEDVHNRLYARVSNGHPELTTKFCRQSLDFSKALHVFWGFGETVPSLDIAKVKISAHVAGSSATQPLQLQIRTLHSIIAQFENQLEVSKEQATNMATKIDLLYSKIVELLSTALPSQFGPIPSNGDGIKPTPPSSSSSVEHSCPSLIPALHAPLSHHLPEPLSTRSPLNDSFASLPLDDLLPQSPDHFLNSFPVSPAQVHPSSESLPTHPPLMPSLPNPQPHDLTPTSQPTKAASLEDLPSTSSRSVMPPAVNTQPESLHRLVLIPISTSHSVITPQPSPFIPLLKSTQLIGSPPCSPSPSGSTSPLFSSPPHNRSSSPSSPMPNLKLQTHSSPFFSSLPNVNPQPAKAQLFSSRRPQSQAHSFPHFSSPAPNSLVQAQPSPLNSSHSQTPAQISQAVSPSLLSLLPSRTLRSIKGNRSALTDLSPQVSPCVMRGKHNRGTQKTVRKEMPVGDENFNPTTAVTVETIGSLKRKSTSAAAEGTPTKRRRVLTCFECSTLLSSRTEAMEHYMTEHQRSVTAHVKWAGGKKSKTIRYWRSENDFMFHCIFCSKAFELPAEIQAHTENLSESSATQHAHHKESMPSWLRKKYKNSD